MCLRSLTFSKLVIPRLVSSRVLDTSAEIIVITITISDCERWRAMFTLGRALVT